MSLSIDTTKAYLSRVHGEVTAIYTWINDKRAMVLAATYRPGNPFVPGAPIYVLFEENAHAYAEPQQLHDTANKAAEVLGLGGMAWYKIANIIIEGLPDLIEMPSAPQEKEYFKGSYGQMILSADGKPIAADEIRMEKEGVEYGAV
jgi:hypothetical protein